VTSFIWPFVMSLLSVGSGRDLIRPQSRHDRRNGDGCENPDDDHHHEQFEHAERCKRLA
jgi:hypothetical protein